MHLSIGDVVRDQGTQVFGTVAGVTEHPDGDLVAVRVSGGGTHHADPHSLALVARSAAPATGGHELFRVLVLVLAFLASTFAVSAAQDVGGDLVLMFLSGLGGATATFGLGRLLVRLAGPRRFRV